MLKQLDDEKLYCKHIDTRLKPRCLNNGKTVQNLEKKTLKTLS